MLNLRPPLRSPPINFRITTSRRPAVHEVEYTCAVSVRYLRHCNCTALYAVTVTVHTVTIHTLILHVYCNPFRPSHAALPFWTPIRCNRIRAPQGSDCLQFRTQCTWPISAQSCRILPNPAGRSNSPRALLLPGFHAISPFHHFTISPQPL